MTTSLSTEGSAYAAAAPRLLDSLFYAVSHDLRSPLLTVTLSAQLLEHQLANIEVDGADDVLVGLRAACDDMERMLEAMNALSRASRRVAEPFALRLEALCPGAPAGMVTLDEPTGSELQAAVPADATASIDGGDAIIRWPIDGLEGSPLTALTGSLQQHAGGAVQALACLEIALERHHAGLSVDEGQVTVRLPLADTVSS